MALECLPEAVDQPMFILLQRTEFCVYLLLTAVFPLPCSRRLLVKPSIWETWYAEGSVFTSLCLISPKFGVNARLKLLGTTCVSHPVFTSSATLSSSLCYISCFASSSISHYSRWSHIWLLCYLSWLAQRCATLFPWQLPVFTSNYLSSRIPLSPVFTSLAISRSSKNWKPLVLITVQICVYISYNLFFSVMHERPTPWRLCLHLIPAKNTALWLLCLQSLRTRGGLALCLQSLRTRGRLNACLKNLVLCVYITVRPKLSTTPAEASYLVS
jgi:hypothetical protein